MSSTRRARSRVPVWLAALLAATLGIGGIAVPAAAASGGGAVTGLDMPNVPLHNGTPLLTAGESYTVQLGYTRMADGARSVVEIPDGLTIPASALVVSAGNTAVHSLSLDADGDLVIEFADPFPARRP